MRRPSSWPGMHWTRPVAPDPVDAGRWAAFCAELAHRIDRIRWYEGIDTRLGDAWRTFEQALPEAAPVPDPLPIGLVAPRPITPRGEHGRYRRAS